MPNLVNENYQEILQQVEDGTYPFTIEVSAQEFNETVPEGCISSQVPFGASPIARGRRHHGDCEPGQLEAVPAGV